jgi:tetratricopeptide (TPR) repeat protein
VPEETRSRFEEILARDETNEYALVGIGDVERRAKNYERAIEFYTRCLDTNPENNYALFGLAESYRALRRYKDAIAIWERYLLYDNSNVTVLTRVADAYRKTGTFERSRELYVRVLDIEHDNPYALIGLGHLHYDFHDFETAKHYWERMYEASAPRPDIRVLTSLGNCHRKLKTYENGVPYFFEALTIENDNFYALYGLADCYRGMRLADRSLEYWERILTSDPDNKVILTRAGDACLALGDLDRAESYYRRALDLDFDLFAMIGLAVLHRRRGEYTDAISTLEELNTSNPENARIVLELVSCYEAQRDLDTALSVLERYAETVRRPTRAITKRLRDVRRAVEARSS